MNINIQNNAVRIFAFLFAILFLFLSLSLPSFAATDPASKNDYDFTDQPLPKTSGSTTAEYVKNNGLHVAVTSSGIRDIYAIAISNYDVYFFQYTGLNSSAAFVCVNDNADLTDIKVAYAMSNGNTTFTYYESTLSWDSDYNCYKSTIGLNNNWPYTLFHCPAYNNLSNGINAVINWDAEHGSSSGEVSEFNYSIPAGYALYIDIHGLSDVQGTLSTTTSRAFASPHESNQTLSYQASLPGGNVSPLGNGISWRGVGNKDLFGRYKSWSSTLIVQPNKNYIAIYNPVHIDTYVDPEHEDYNSSINVHVNQAYADSSILIPLNTELTGTGTIGTNTTDEEKPMHYDPDSNTWYPTNQDGTPYTPTPYGDYLPSTMNSIHDWLQNIANLISGFFNGAIGAVTTLVSAGSAFINTLVSLYSWLPAPVYAVLSSALILVITIGVIKVFI